MGSTYMGPVYLVCTAPTRGGASADYVGSDGGVRAVHSRRWETRLTGGPDTSAGEGGGVRACAACCCWARRVGVGRSQGGEGRATGSRSRSGRLLGRQPTRMRGRGRQGESRARPKEKRREWSFLFPNNFLFSFLNSNQI